MTVIVTRAAAQDIDDAYDYVSEHDPAAADRQTDRFEALFAKLAEMPGIGSPRDEFQAGLRSRGVGRYVINYKVIGDDLLIVRVVHGARNHAALFDTTDDAANV
ncbi:type II toxin-antitoxin system RelE/ParE family toxin [Blastomonas sp.]|uniref:type II toxin-antitoxin system RelE/ParE family toxin n=1 Tax=Blastomonas sp. TaxID=1909299 RepID=UPI003593E6A1